MPRRLLHPQAPRHAETLLIPLRLPVAVAGAVVVPGAGLGHLLPLRLLTEVVAGAAVAAKSHLPTMTPTTLRLAAVVAVVGAVAVVVGAVVVEGAAGATTQTLRRRRS